MSADTTAPGRIGGQRWRCALALIGLVLAGAVHAEPPRASAARLAAAENALAAGAPEIACHLATGVAWPAALRDQALLVAANCRAATGRYDEAARGFAVLAERHPQEERLRLDQALALAMAGDTAGADAVLDRLLGDNLSETMRQRAERLRAQLDSGTRWQFGASLSTAYLYDSNVTAGPDSRIIRAYGLPFRLDPRSMERSDHGVEAYMSVLAQYRVSRRAVLGLHANAGHINYRSLDVYDTTTLALSPYLGLRLGASSLVLSAYGASQSLDHDLYARHYGSSVALSSPIADTLVLTARASAARSDYANSDPRDTRNYGLGTGLEWIPGDGRWRLGLQYGYRRELAEVSVFSNVGHSLSGDVRYALSERLTVHAGAGYAHADYDAPMAAFGKRREDRYAYAEAGMSWLIARLASAPVRVSLTLRKAEQSSNIPLYDYDRLRASVGGRIAF